MNRVFQDYVDAFLIVFIDDTVVYSKSEDENLGHMKVVLQVLKEKQFYANHSKCEFLLR